MDSLSKKSKLSRLSVSFIGMSLLICWHWKKSSHHTMSFSSSPSWEPKFTGFVRVNY